VTRLTELVMPPREQFPGTLRLVRVQTEDGSTIDLLTNDHRLSANTIGEIYRDRWKVELFFKALKQNLKVKSFIGTTENALRIQIWTALLALLILKWLHFLAAGRLALSTVATLLRQNLFAYRDLRAFFTDPISASASPPPSQIDLPLDVIRDS
jgi:IS4 transposase